MPGNPFRNRSDQVVIDRDRPKQAAVRVRSLLDLAHRVNVCTLMLPGVCSGYAVEGCEPAHANSMHAGKGLGRKADDHMHAAACHACHAELDQGNRFTYEQKVHYWRLAHDRTFGVYFRERWLVVR